MAKINISAKNQWLRALDALTQQVARWATSRNWDVIREEVTRTEGDLGTYPVTTLTIESPSGRIVIEPVARYAVACDGRVDVYAWPTYNRLMLRRKGDAWELATDSGVRWPQAWNEETFVELASALSNAA